MFAKRPGDVSMQSILARTAAAASAGQRPLVFKSTPDNNHTHAVTASSQSPMSSFVPSDVVGEHSLAGIPSSQPAPLSPARDEAHEAPVDVEINADADIDLDEPLGINGASNSNGNGHASAPAPAQAPAPASDNDEISRLQKIVSSAPPMPSILQVFRASHKELTLKEARKVLADMDPATRQIYATECNAEQAEWKKAHPAVVQAQKDLRKIRAGEKKKNAPATAAAAPAPTTTDSAPASASAPKERKPRPRAKPASASVSAPTTGLSTADKYTKLIELVANIRSSCASEGVAFAFDDTTAELFVSAITEARDERARAAPSKPVSAPAPASKAAKKTKSKAKAGDDAEGRVHATVLGEEDGMLPTIVRTSGEVAAHGRSILSDDDDDEDDGHQHKRAKVKPAPTKKHAPVQAHKVKTKTKAKAVVAPVKKHKHKHDKRERVRVVHVQEDSSDDDDHVEESDDDDSNSNSNSSGNDDDDSDMRAVDVDADDGREVPWDVYADLSALKTKSKTKAKPVQVSSESESDSESDSDDEDDSGSDDEEQEQQSENASENASESGEEQSENESASASESG